MKKLLCILTTLCLLASSCTNEEVVITEEEDLYEYPIYESPEDYSNELPGIYNYWSLFEADTLVGSLSIDSLFILHMDTFPYYSSPSCQLDLEIDWDGVWFSALLPQPDSIPLRSPQLSGTWFKADSSFSFEFRHFIEDSQASYYKTRFYYGTRVR